MGVSRLVISGYTPYPQHPNDTRLPHISRKLHNQIHKTALGAESTIPWEYDESVVDTIAELKREGYVVAALEQTPQAMALHQFHAPEKIALLLGREVEGIEASLLHLADHQLMIPMYGQKESFNVVQAAAMALYQLRFG